MSADAPFGALPAALAAAAAAVLAVDQVVQDEHEQEKEARRRSHGSWETSLYDVSTEGNNIIPVCHLQRDISGQ